ncbi:hypothetical protein Tco_0478724 [Tanacetum coccineum]
MTLENAQAQLIEMKRLVDLKVEQEKTKQKLKALSNEEPEAQDSMSGLKCMLWHPRIKEKKIIFCSETSRLSLSGSTLKLKKMGIPPPPELTAFGLFAAKNKRKRSSEILKEVFVKEDIVVDGTHRNLVPSPGVKGSRGLVIRESESEIFFYNGNFDLVFQREEEFHLATTAQLIRTQSAIQRGTPEVEEIFKKMELTIEARNDVTEARRIVKENLDVLGQNMHKRVLKDSLSAKPQRATSDVFKSSNIFKDVEDYLKTYSSGGMNISLLNRVARDSIGSTGFSEKIVSFYVFGIIQVIARLYLKDDDAVNAEAFINKVLFFVNTTVTTRAGQKNSENLLVFQVRVSKTLKGSTQTLKSVSSFGEDKVYLWSVYGQKKVQRL